MRKHEVFKNQMAVEYFAYTLEDLRECEEAREDILLWNLLTALDSGDFF